VSNPPSIGDFGMIGIKDSVILNIDSVTDRSPHLGFCQPGMDAAGFRQATPAPLLCIAAVE
jgi:hypothetical protein